MENLGKIITTARKLNNIGRWANEFLHQRSSVAEHSFSVAQIAQLLGVLEEENGATLDWKRLYRKALNHDIPEAVMGDVISTTKNSNAEVKKALSLVEETLVEDNLLVCIEEPYRSIYREIIFDGKDETIEGKILSAADNIDALIECIQEVKLCNKEPFLEKYGYILQKIKSIDLFSANFFVKNILPYIISDCDMLKDIG